MTMPTLPERTEARAHHAKRLRAAAALVQRSAPDGPDKVTVLRRLDRLAAALERDEIVGICPRCDAEFLFSPGWFQERGLHLPRHCTRCREERRAERRRAGVGGHVPAEHD